MGYEVLVFFEEIERGLVVPGHKTCHDGRRVFGGCGRGLFGSAQACAKAGKNAVASRHGGRGISGEGVELTPHGLEGIGLIDRRWSEKRPEKNKQRDSREQASQYGEKLECGPAPTPVVVKNEIVLFQSEGKLSALKVVMRPAKSQCGSGSVARAAGFVCPTRRQSRW